MLSRAVRPSLLLAVGLLVGLAGCTKLKDVEIVNPCSTEIVVNLWETPTPAGSANDEPERIVIGPLSRVVAKDALADVGKDGSSAEIVSGPGRGEGMVIPHGGKLLVIIPAALCSDVAP